MTRPPRMVYSHGWKLPAVIETTERRCYCISLPDLPEYRAAFLDQMVNLFNWSKWARDTDRNATLVAQYLRNVLLPQLEMEFMCCCDQTSAILQFQIMNQFLIWADFSVNTDINIYAPVTTFETTTGETTAERQGRIDALCYALRGMVDTMCVAAIQILDQQINSINLLAALGAIISGVLGLLSFGTGYVLGFAITSALLYAVGSLAGLVTKPQLENLEARAELACAIRDAIKDLAPTEANLWSTIDGLGGLSDDAMALLSVLQHLHVRAEDSKHIFEAFINALGEGQQLGIAGILPPCECCADTEYVYDYHSGDWTTLDPFVELTTSDIPIADLPLDPPESSGDYRFELVAFDGHLAYAGGSLPSADAIGLIWGVPDEVLGCTLMEVSVGAYDPNYAAGYIFVDRGFGWEYIAGLGLYTSYSVKTASLGLSHILRVAFVLNSSYTSSSEARVAYVRFLFS